MEPRLDGSKDMTQLEKSLAVDIARMVASKMGITTIIDNRDSVLLKQVPSRDLVKEATIAVRADEVVVYAGNVLHGRSSSKLHEKQKFLLADPHCFDKIEQYVVMATGLE